MNAAGHPALHAIAESPADELRMAAFATELASHLLGDDSALSPLGRVVVRVARRELVDARALCDGRPLLAVEAAVRATVALWPYLRALEPPPAEPPQGPQDEPAEEDASSGGAAAGNDGDGDDGSDSEADEDLRKAASAAVDGALKADQTMRQVERLLPGVGWSMAPGVLEDQLLDGLEAMAKLAQRLPDLVRIADLLGRMESQARRAGEALGGSEEVAGVHLGGSIAEALPAELGLLGDDDVEDLFYQRLVEQRLLSLELVGAGLNGTSAADHKGPVILAIDTSGSMVGAPETLAKAFVLAVARRVVSQGRTAHLLLFGGPGETSEIRISRGSSAANGIVEFLGRAFGAGTDFDTPLLRAVALLGERHLAKADVVVVTDGLGYADPSVVEAVAVAKRDGVRFHAVVLGAMSVDGVRPFADHLWSLDADALEGAGDLLARL